jgi:hypothetical protein
LGNVATRPQQNRTITVDSHDDWHLGYTEEARAAAFTQVYGALQHAAFKQEPTYRIWSILTA